MSRRSPKASFALALTALVLASCATVKPIPDAGEPSWIKAASKSFSPTGDPATRTMDLELGFGRREAVQSWEVRIAAGNGIVRAYSGVGPDLPASIAWDGRAGLGLPCPEGDYYAMFSVGYGEAYNPSPVSWTDFALVSSPPSLRASAEPASLTPIGRGMERSVEIKVEASSPRATIARWTVEILDGGGAVVRSFSGSAAEQAAIATAAREATPGAESAVAAGAAPAGAAAGAARLAATASWDGRTDAGTWALPATTYRARVRAADDFGNVGETLIEIPVGERATAIEPSSIVPAAPGFSPTGDAASRSMILALSVGNRDALSAWSVEIVAGGSVLERYGGAAADLPPTLTWDGRADSGEVWPEGEYRARLSLDYGLVYKPASAESPPFILAASPPSLRLAATPSAFTPMGRGMAEPVAIGVDVSSRFAAAAEWTVEIIDPLGETIRAFTGSGAFGRAVWDGITKAGAWVEPSKVYTARVTARDEYGNVGAASLAIPVKAQPDAPERSSIAAGAAGFSPTGDPSRRIMTLVPAFGSREAIQSWAVEIMTGSVVLKRIAGTGRSLPASLTWDGISETGSPWPEGEYFAALSVDYGVAFNPVKVIGNSFKLVTSPPVVKLGAKPAALTPAGKSMEEPVTIAVEAGSRLAKMAAWTVEILDPRGEPVRAFSGLGAAGAAAWDGFTKSGALAEPSKTYTARATARDEYGNAASSELQILVRGRADAPARSSIEPKAPGFSPTGDPGTRSMTFALSFGERDSVASWTVEIKTGTVTVKKFGGSAASLPSSLSWDGISETGSVWPEGEYYAALTVDYGSVYNPAKATSSPFLLVATQPETVLAASPREFTPKALGMEGPVALSVKASSRLAKVTGWAISIKDDTGREVKGFSGTGAQGSASWDGALADGTYAEPAAAFSALATARDEYGNVGAASLAIAVRERPEAPEVSFVETEAKGFSPVGDRAGGKIDFSVMIGDPGAMRSWKVEIGRGAEVARTFSGAAGSAPSGLSWDGRDEGGALSPEGSYSALLSVDYGRTYKPASSRTKDFALALSPPTARLSLAPEAFVPSEQGVAGPVAIMIQASSPVARIDSWTLDLQDAQGRPVRSFSGKWPVNQAVWDGTTQAGGFVEPASSYQAKALVVDEYGNRGSATASVPVREIPAATEPSLIVPRSGGFSPAAGPGKPKSVDFVLKIGNLAQMKSWKVTMAHAERGAQKSFGGTAAPAGTLAWDGRTDAGGIAPDGAYNALLAIDYGKGFKPATARSEGFFLQAAPPEVKLELSPPRLTPRAGVFERPVQISLRATAPFAEIEGWTISILDPAGATIAFFKDSAASGRVSWDGRTSAGTYVEASTTCSVLAEARDGFGNSGAARAYIPVDDLPPVPGENSIVPAAAGFSPNGDGAMDAIELKLSVANREAVRSWKVLVSHSEKGPRKTFSGDAASLPPSVAWSGRDDAGAASPEGYYSAELAVDYGTMYKAASAKSRRFVLATSAPAVKVAVSPAAAEPDEDGFLAPAQAALDAASPLGRIASWKLAIVDSAGRAAKSFEGSWPPGPIAWDGVAEDGSLAPPGSSYAIEASAEDEFGISGKARASLAVGPLPAATEESGIASTSRGFSPAAGGSMRFVLVFGNRNLIKSWSVDVEREDRTVRMSFPGAAGDFPGSFAWNGRLQDGTIAPDGRYLARLNIQYGRAYAPVSAESAAFVLAASPPEVSLEVEPALFSPDGDGAAETLTIKLRASSRLAAIADWNVDVLDPGGNLFANFRGQGEIPAIAWDGRNAKGETVESAEDYPIEARVRDEFGNLAEAKSAAHIDILLVKSGDGYRIRVASIVFKSFTADYQDVPADRAERNLATLNLLAEKLKKFPGYQIRIVGHAVMINWDDPAKGKAEQEKVLLPLSRSRADAIRQALAARGIEASRMATDGVGAADQIVPDSDFENRWKNRRVEFFLAKKK